MTEMHRIIFFIYRRRINKLIVWVNSGGGKKLMRNVFLADQHYYTMYYILLPLDNALVLR